MYQASGIHRSLKQFLSLENFIILLWIQTGNMRSSKRILNWSQTEVPVTQTEVPVTQAESPPTPGLPLLLAPHPGALLFGLGPLTPSCLPLSLRLRAKALVWVALRPPLDDGICSLPESLPPANPPSVLPHMAPEKSFLEPKPVHVTPPPKLSATSPESKPPMLARGPSGLCTCCPQQLRRLTMALSASVCQSC